MGPRQAARFGCFGISIVRLIKLILLRVAKKLGWTKIFCIHQGKLSEEEARLFNYRMDSERGGVDPFRLAETFKWFHDQGLTQEQIAKKFGIARSTVANQLGLLGLVPRGTQLVREGELSVSHVEPIARLPAEQLLTERGKLTDTQLVALLKAQVSTEATVRRYIRGWRETGHILRVKRTGANFITDQGLLYLREVRPSSSISCKVELSSLLSPSFYIETY